MANINLSLSDDLASVADNLRQSTVQVGSGNDSVGSGVIWRSDGLIITNSHVVRFNNPTITLSDGKVFPGEVTARDPIGDLAAIQVKATDLPAAEIGNSDRLRVGELVLAVGNPLGVAGALTNGIIHAIGQKEQPNKRANFPSPTWIQADIQLAPGNSGGCLADARGRVIGINTMIANGLALAIPSNAVESFVQLGSFRPRLGVTTQPVLVQQGRKRILGLLVLAVTPGSPAQRAGICAFDVLIKAGDAYFRTPNDLVQMLWQVNPPLMLSLELIRRGQRHSINVLIGEQIDLEAA
jgi:serine protease Do